MKANEVGNARRLILLEKENVTRIKELEKWFVWNKRFWEEKEECALMDIASDVIGKSIAVAKSNSVPNPELVRFLESSLTEKSLRSMVSLAKNQLTVSRDDMNRDKYCLQCQGGSINLHTGKLEKPRKENFDTRRSPTPFIQNSKCPTWMKFLHQVMGNDHEKVRFLQRVIGYSLTGATNEHCLFLLYGNGRNGKTVFLNTIREVLGSTYARNLPYNALLSTKWANAIPYDIAFVSDARFVVTSEINKEFKLDEAKVKTLTGEDYLTARHLYGQPFEFKPEFKLFLSTNNLPNISGKDEGIWRRLLVIPFDLNLRKDDEDRNLQERLALEAPGILQWAIDGCIEWTKDGIQTPKSIVDINLQYRSRTDEVLKFIRTNYIEESCEWEFTEVVYSRFVSWANLNNVKHSITTQSALTRRLKYLGYNLIQKRNNDKNNKKAILGIKAISD